MTLNPAALFAQAIRDRQAYQINYTHSTQELMKPFQKQRTFQSAPGIELPETLEHDLTALGFNQEQIATMMSTKEQAVDGLAQRVPQKDDKPNAAGPARATRKRGNDGAAGQYRNLCLHDDENKRNWVLYNPEAAMHATNIPLPPFMARFARYEPGHSHILEFNTVSHSVRMRTPTRAIEGRAVDYTPQGPRFTGPEPAALPSQAKTDAAKPVQKRAAPAKTSRAAAAAGTKRKAADAFTPTSIPPSSGETVNSAAPTNPKHAKTASPPPPIPVAMSMPLITIIAATPESEPAPAGTAISAPAERQEPPQPAGGVNTRPRRQGRPPVRLADEMAAASVVTARRAVRLGKKRKAEEEGKEKGPAAKKPAKAGGRARKVKKEKDGEEEEEE
ncbi:hypothetical protein K431DRAFT_308679 [Polychaeton citri CBS 116435]|uniref:Uncharacterized protein n=1 Tax=Polychaeton citri CBS 116435 TaxID=1314669 RepID=A0A9P4QK67_9PEZI|nr:hypothetical protein K431DRAFT_308679 [Polychaeton citri CBS 116435]